MRASTPRSPGGRIALALAFWAGFYVLAFAVAGGLLYFAYYIGDRGITEQRAQNAGGSFLLTLILIGAAIVAAGMILYSCLPRFRRWHPPGPLLDPKRHPALFQEIQHVARDCRQKMADDVYLTLEVNAWVLDRRRYWIFPRRVLAIGLPLLQSLTVSQFRSVLAHEFGHFVGGDTRLSPWVYRTHAAIERTVAALEGQDSIWRFPFLIYARFFTRISLEISRRQEYLADELSARIAGVRASTEALKRIHRAGAAFGTFVHDELSPVLDAGKRPPIVEGFTRFMASPQSSKALAQRMSTELVAKPDHKDDTHPPLALRIEALRGLAPGPDPRSDPPALDLLQDVDQMELEILQVAMGNQKAGGLPRITWEEVPDQALLPTWREAVGTCWKEFKGITPASFPDLDLTSLGRRIDNDTTDSEARGVAMRALGFGLLVALKDRGWTLGAAPGERLSAARGEVKVDPCHIFLDLAEGLMSRAEWKAKCEAGQFGDLDLGFALTPPPESPPVKL